jgi:hypothetical protein
MAKYETTFYVPRPLEATFAFISDFRNAVKWDPRTYAVEKVTPGPIGAGTRFLLTGGMLPKTGPLTHLLPKALLRGMPLSYEIVAYEPPHRLVLKGETPLLSYEDVIEFMGEGMGVTVRYSARLDLRGVLAIGDPVLRLAFKRIGDDATRDIPAVVGRAGEAA